MNGATLQPFHLMAKPAGAACNLDCQYCFYLSKGQLYPNSRLRMSEEVLEAYLRQLIEAQRAAGQAVNVSWQGGEPTLMGLAFFERSVALVERFKRPRQRVQYAIQTNGVLLDDAWCSFFKRHDFLVGLSIDGPQPLHDAYRTYRNGKGSFDEVMRAWQMLAKHGVDVNVLCTLHSANAEHPLEVYRFFRDDLSARFLQFVPIVERCRRMPIELADAGSEQDSHSERELYTQSGNIVTDRSIAPAQYGQFLIEVFEEWVRRDVGQVFVQLFDAALGAHLGQYSLCVFAPRCGRAMAMEHNGDVYSCDHYVAPAFLLGNLRAQRLADLAASPQQRSFGDEKETNLPRDCWECDVRFACNGGCPKDRFLETPDGQQGLNYLCEGYKQFFRHVDRPMRLMAALIQQRRPPAEIMQWYATQN
jgi:uncharacterized protein